MAYVGIYTLKFVIEEPERSAVWGVQASVAYTPAGACKVQCLHAGWDV